MEVRYGKQFSLPGRKPQLPVFSLAFWTVPVPAAVVADPDRAAVRAGIHVPPEVCGPAAFQSGDGPKLPSVDLGVVFYLMPVLPEYVSHFKGGSHSAFLYSLSSGPKGLTLPDCATWR
jgi:hypothetical protein